MVQISNNGGNGREITRGEVEVSDWSPDVEVVVGETTQSGEIEQNNGGLEEVPVCRLDVVEVIGQNRGWGEVEQDNFSESTKAAIDKSVELERLESVLDEMDAESNWDEDVEI